ncbi:DUF2845 domain-containing protein [Algibacillus agarilyticus]|uniref:DUF2845 domain-containing protein n=1 Tax=Algibacillus agarilyticus TaxID=2234133 RepID=UPI000DD09466|nr:DUF2845 domain-containing protein [Algibacillus agarilyticus]
MTSKPKFVALLFYCSILYSTGASAGLHCPNGYITEGDELALVIKKCGKPQKQVKLASNYRKHSFPKGKKLRIDYSMAPGDFERQLYFIDKQLFVIEKGKRTTY